MSDGFEELDVKSRTRMPKCGATLTYAGAMFRLSAEASRKAAFLEGKRLRIRINRQEKTFRLIEGDTGPQMSRAEYHFQFNCIELLRAMEYEAGQVFAVEVATIDGVKGVNFTPVEAQ